MKANKVAKSTWFFALSLMVCYLILFYSLSQVTGYFSQNTVELLVCAQVATFAAILFDSMDLHVTLWVYSLWIVSFLVDTVFAFAGFVFIYEHLGIWMPFGIIITILATLVFLSCKGLALISAFPIFVDPGEGEDHAIVEVR